MFHDCETICISDAFQTEKEGGSYCGIDEYYDMNATDAEFVCSTYLHTTLATTNELISSHNKG